MLLSPALLQPSSSPIFAPRVTLLGKRAITKRPPRYQCALTPASFIPCKKSPREELARQQSYHPSSGRLKTCTACRFNGDCIEDASGYQSTPVISSVVLYTVVLPAPALASVMYRYQVQSILMTQGDSHPAPIGVPQPAQFPVYSEVYPLKSEMLVASSIHFVVSFL